MATSLLSLIIILLLLLSFTRPQHYKEEEKPLINYCIQDKDCNPQIFNNQNLSQYVQCSHEGLCQCSSCFILNTTRNQCYTLPGCTLYDNVTRTCYDIRKRRTIAIIYAAALAIGGAANFYIERWELAIPQALIGLDYEFDQYEYEGPVIKDTCQYIVSYWRQVLQRINDWNNEIIITLDLR
uniref:Uncharacterized protein n=1 Tax=Amphimedon queenslandica TaxID=400682 RepID=A0A1X7TA79_AMPQE